MFKFACIAFIKTPLVFASEDVCPTVVIEREDNKGNKVPVTINASDYNEKEHGPIFEGNDDYEADGTMKARATAPTETVAPSKAQKAAAIGNTNEGDQVDITKLGVLERKKKFYVVSANGQPVEMDGIEHKGYSDNASAWKAITDLQAARAAAGAAGGNGEQVTA